MPLVFVHGVANRRGSTDKEIQAFERRVAARDEAFRKISFATRVRQPAALHIENPYWGDNAASFAWNLASIPAGDEEAFGAAVLGSEAGRESEAGRLAQVALVTTTNRAASALHAGNCVLLTLARQESLEFAIDALFAASAQVAPGNATPADVAAFAARAMQYALKNPRPPWLDRVDNDQRFLERLDAELAQGVPGDTEVFGVSEVLNHLKNAALRLGAAAVNVLAGVAKTVGDVAGAAVGAATEPLVRQARPAISSLVGQFFGDIFVYIQNRGPRDAPGPIVKTVIEGIEAAIAKRTPADDKLYIVAHSMGGQIAYDILTFYRPDLRCDLLVTVGSQVGFFEELKLLQVSNPAIRASSAQHSVAKPANVGRWLNVFDLTDLFGFTEEGIFQDVDNFKFDTQTLPILSHGMYFVRPRFHERLGRRIADAIGAPP